MGIGGVPEKQQKIDGSKPNLASLKAKIDRLNNGFTEGSMDIDEFKELKNPLIPKKVELEQQIIAFGKKQSQSARTLAELDFRGKCP